ncbi:hypothetical protein HYH03_011800 [Edaphochlamys debaryana]|uniref:Pherophorin domain-containing protein n=1 Tax=Edaphochlamys debaryana TaxID=47281 RepID=A0A835XT91_9CHLO|nr:hypothetical protein HYH03_011800 [Edaphochlamys debaryana]|eukprot:KAG2489691.1 hypothetical protein HYH03_011800 [Edaphochlamys debaryana]
MRRVAAAFAVLALAAGVAAQFEDEDPTVSAIENPGQVFPYASCLRPLSTSVYSAVPVAKTTSFSYGERTCWTFLYRDEQCTKPNATLNGKWPACCEQGFHKFEININRSCVPAGGSGRPFTANATYKGKATVVPYARLWNDGAGATLYVTGLDAFGPAVNGTQFCLTLLKADNMCPTLKKLAPEWPKWSLAMWDENHKCCPVSNGSYPSPPPPRPVVPCETCYSFFTVSGPGVPPSNWFADPAHCANAQSAWEDFFLGSPTVPEHIASGFNTYECSGDTFKVCGAYVSVNDATAVVNAVDWDALLAQVFLLGDACPVELSGQRVFVSGSNDECGFYSGSRDCAFPPPPFPNCTTCLMSQVLQFTVGQVITTRRASAASTYHCASVTINEEPTTGGQLAKFCNKVTELKKVEFWLDWEKRLDIESVVLFSKDVPKGKSVSIAWDRPSNSARITALDWTVSWVAANEPQICFEIDNVNGGILDLTPRPAEKKLWWSAFDHSNRCCPTEASSPLE